MHTHHIGEWHFEQAVVHAGTIAYHFSERKKLFFSHLGQVGQVAFGCHLYAISNGLKKRQVDDKMLIFKDDSPPVSDFFPHQGAKKAFSVLFPILFCRSYFLSEPFRYKGIAVRLTVRDGAW